MTTQDEIIDWEDHPAIIDGSIEEAAGRFWAYCCICDKLDELPCDLFEIEGGNYQHYCGGSPRCCP